MGNHEASPTGEGKKMMINKRKIAYDRKHILNPEDKE